MNNWWINSWEKSYKKIFWHDDLPYCIDDDGIKRYASWQVTDLIQPKDWKPADIEIPHLVKPLGNGKDKHVDNKHHYRMYTSSYPKTKYRRQIERAIERNNLTYIDEGFDDIIAFKKLKYNMSNSVINFLELIKDYVVVRSLYNNNEFYAGNIGIMTEKGMGHWIPTYNPKYSGSGQVLIYYMMEENGSVDFMLGNEDYKKIWNPTIDHLYTGHL